MELTSYQQRIVDTVVGFDGSAGQPLVWIFQDDEGAQRSHGGYGKTIAVCTAIAQLMTTRSVRVGCFFPIRRAACMFIAKVRNMIQELPSFTASQVKRSTSSCLDLHNGSGVFCIFKGDGKALNAELYVIDAIEAISKTQMQEQIAPALLISNTRLIINARPSNDITGPLIAQLLESGVASRLETQKELNNKTGSVHDLKFQDLTMKDVEEEKIP